jgi:hypothetical protein
VREHFPDEKPHPDEKLRQMVCCGSTKALSKWYSELVAETILIGDAALTSLLVYPSVPLGKLARMSFAFQP